MYIFEILNNFIQPYFIHIKINFLPIDIFFSVSMSLQTLNDIEQTIQTSMIHVENKCHFSNITIVVKQCYYNL